MTDQRAYDDKLAKLIKFVKQVSSEIKFTHTIERFHQIDIELQHYYLFQKIARDLLKEIHEL